MGRTKARAQITRRAELSRLIWAAARAIDPNGKGSIALLAKKAEVSEATIRLAMREGGFKRGTALILEHAIGAELLPKEKLCSEFA